MIVIKSCINWGENERVMVGMKLFKIGVKILNEWERKMDGCG